MIPLLLGTLFIAAMLLANELRKRIEGGPAGTFTGMATLTNKRYTRDHTYGRSPWDKGELYLGTFVTDDGTERELCMSEQEWNEYQIGDRGLLTWERTRLENFEKEVA